MIGKCAEEEFGVFSSVNTTYDISKSKFTNAFSYPVYSSCLSKTTSTSHPAFDNNTNSKCKHYYQKGGSTGAFYCISCKNGKTSKIHNNSGHTYLTCDQDIVGCSNEIFGGFILNQSSLEAHGFNSSIFYSCHQCAPGYIPFLFAPLVNKKVQF